MINEMSAPDADVISLLFTAVVPPLIFSITCLQSDPVVFGILVLESNSCSLIENSALDHVTAAPFPGSRAPSSDSRGWGSTKQLRNLNHVSLVPVDRIVTRCLGKERVLRRQ
jgi:hypothetical protein